ncbi:hypothetical protein D7D52_21000 [Nocardia yunnanensis]|uniref:Uncharacterized protein n=1 Tax=Nocardia yunnanensis TaxID=2382165 RepID=A0A386ZES7_9NOCA|nr:hypothetical protein [Nocardia yunnanensis]AYF75907.1 hypothetical protein D7D52_21000 [Nocardia yunnanensis]
MTVNGRGVVDPNDLTEREFVALFARRSGMYIGRPDVRGVTSFLNGYDAASRRSGRPLLDGFHEWLIANHIGHQNSLAWWALIELIALPDHDRAEALTPEQESRVLEVLFDLLDTFLAEREFLHEACWSCLSAGHRWGRFSRCRTGPFVEPADGKRSLSAGRHARQRGLPGPEWSAGPR